MIDFHANNLGLNEPVIDCLENIYATLVQYEPSTLYYMSASCYQDHAELEGA